MMESRYEPPRGANPARGSQWFDWLFLSAAVISIASLISPKVEIAVGQGKKRIARWKHWTRIVWFVLVSVPVFLAITLIQAWFPSWIFRGRR